MASEDIWMAELARSPMRERMGYVSARCNLLGAHEASLRQALHAVIHGERPLSDVASAIGNMRATLDRIELEMSHYPQASMDGLAGT